MSAVQIHQWREVRADFADALVLGNGASMAFDMRFSYRSLREEAEHRGLISKDVRKVFRHLKTSDFELVLRVLWHAESVNGALGISERRTSAAYESVKKALIGVVREIHPTFADVRDRLPTAAEFMGRFKTVLSLSYDVLVYWAIQVGNEATHNRYKDCLIDGHLTSDWEQLRVPYPPSDRATLVFYPHGNIALAGDVAGIERKVHSQQMTRLLPTVLDGWRRGAFAPVFVSEGTSKQKRSSIRRSPYLSTVYDEVLPTAGPTVVFHGLSLRRADDHVLDALLVRNCIHAVAVGANPRSPTVDGYMARVRTQVRRRLGQRGYALQFYDRESPGCWVAPSQ